jgi:phosphoribosylformylglycinamidine cyclo-ligase
VLQLRFGINHINTFAKPKHMTNSKKNKLSYSDAGVDIARGEQFVANISPLAKATVRPGVIGGLGGFGGVFDLKATGFRDPLIVAATDGVGTKLLLAIDLNRHNTIGIDLVAMCVNDLVVQGAQPLFFLDYFATGKLSLKVAESALKGIVEGCLQSEAALLGGETAEMPQMYAQDHYDLAGFCVGAVERENLIDSSDVKSGDILLGLPSSGVHSNGYSLVRKIVEKSGFDYDHLLEKKPLGEILLEPTRIYVKTVMRLIKNYKVNAIAHITGGGLTKNIPRILPDRFNAKINLSNWPLPIIFRWLKETGDVSPEEMLSTFNCGIGMVFVISKEIINDVETYLHAAGEETYRIGEITEGNGLVEYQNQLFDEK